MDMKQKKHYVYLLKSLTTRKTYIGYTIDPYRRLRQHNGEITGGAKYTRYGKPWVLICYISGFPDKITALQFEWRNHHPLKKWGKRIPGVKGRLIVLKKTLAMDNFTPKCIPRNLLNLMIVWIDTSYFSIWDSLY